MAEGTAHLVDFSLIPDNLLFVFNNFPFQGVVPCQRTQSPLRKDKNSSIHTIK